MKRIFGNPFARAFAEVVVTLAISNFFLLVSVFIYYVGFAGPLPTLHEAFLVMKSNLRAPEVLIYILGILSPTIWYMLANVRASNHVVWFYVVLIFQGVIVLFSTIVYSMDKLGQAKNHELVFLFAWICFCSAVIVWYGILVFQRVLDDGLRATNRGSGDDQTNAPGFMDKLRAP